MFKYIKIIVLCFIGIQGAPNLSHITWEHAVNNKTKLQEALSSDVQMLEADVQLDNQNIPIMAHPPAKTSDLSLENFLLNVTQFNSQNANKQKGMKLDFKTIEAFTTSVPILRNFSEIDQVNLWLNADIINGPGAATTPIPVDAQKFLEQTKQFKRAVLSIGWTTQYPSNVNKYSEDDVIKMLDTIKNNGVNQLISFPVRAVYAAESPKQMSHLLNSTSGSTLTIWSAVNDQVNVTNLRNMIQDIGQDKIYVDVPQELRDQLDLNASGRAYVHPVLLVLLCLIFVV